MTTTTLNMPLIACPGEDGTAIIRCSQCYKKKRIKVSAFSESHVESHKPLKIQCGCGYGFEVLVNTRRHPRKKTNLSGAYVKFLGVGGKEYGFFVVEDISAGGLKFRTRAPHQIHVGEVLKLNFILDDNQGSEVWTSVIIRHVQDFRIGGEFCEIEKLSDELKQYLQINKPA